MNDLEQFRELFDVAFRNPREKEPRVLTERFSDVWLDMEPVGDYLCGPLYSISLRGECNYVFVDQENRFPDVRTPDDLLQWCLALAGEYRSGILAHVPKNEAESADQNVLIQMADAMVALSHLAHRMLKSIRPSG